MKYNKVLSLTLTNGFLLLAFASILASCQKKTIHKNGLFSNYQESTRSRSIASIKPINQNPVIKRFSKFQDPKQINIYCSLNAINVAQCYKRKFNKSVENFIQVKGEISKKDFQEINNHFAFEKVNEQVADIRDNIKTSLVPKITSLVSKRQNFCQNNSKLDFQRCMTQYLERDTFEVLNSFQMKQARMNGHEYLFLKKLIHKSLEEQLISIKKKI